MQSSAPTRCVSRAEYEAIRAREKAACVALAAKWQVDAVGRDYPLHLSRAGPAIAGEWYVIRKGTRRKATVAQERELDRVGGYGVHAIGPSYAAEASTKGRMGLRVRVLNRRLRESSGALSEEAHPLGRSYVRPC